MQQFRSKSVRWFQAWLTLKSAHYYRDWNVIDDLLKRGLLHHQAGRPGEAKSFYEQALAINPRHPDALHLLGLAHLQGGDAGRGAELIRAAARLLPKNPLFHANLAAALSQMGDHEGALAEFRRASSLDRGEPQYQVGIANCHAQLGDYAQAERKLRAVTQRYPRHALAWFNLGNAVRDQGRIKEAADLFRRAIAADPQLFEPHVNLGAALLSLGQLDEAEAEYRRAIEFDPHDAQLRCNLASVLIDRGRFAEAEAECRTAVAYAPEFALAHAFLAAAIGHQGRVLEALEHHRKALALDPANPRALMALGSALCEAGMTAEGKPLLDRAVALAPQSWEAHFSLAIANLSLGMLDDGWREFLHRPTRGRFIGLYPDIKLSSALPATLTGKHVCVQREQGLGDQIFFLRFAPLLKARGARITYRPTPKIASMLERVSVIDNVVPEGGALPPADYTLLVSDLPVALDAGDSSARAPLVPSPLALAPLADQLAAVGSRLALLGPPPYIGLTWRGGIAPEEQRAMAWQLFKEIPLAQFGSALRGGGGTLLALQRNPAPGEIDRLAESAGKAVHDMTALNEDLEAMLALLALIDDYVGVSNTNMHLRAGVGKSARVLVPCPPEWRWLAHGEESPWFPGFRIYRQTAAGTWQDALDLLAADLQSAQALPLH